MMKKRKDRFDNQYPVPYYFSRSRGTLKSYVEPVESS
jgi:hypothetical protein